MTALDNRIWLREVTANDGTEGLRLLQKLVREEGAMVSPAPADIDEGMYPAWLREKADTAKGIDLPEGYVPCTTYWIMCGDRIIGIGNIKHRLNDDLRKKGGHIGIALAADMRRKGYGYTAAKLLVEKARSEFGIGDILMTTDPSNTASRRLCEKLGAELVDTDGHCHYLIKACPLSQDTDNGTSVCVECGSRFLKSASAMKELCPECASVLYGYKNCEHVFRDGVCIKCLWDGSRSGYIRSSDNPLMRV